MFDPQTACAGCLCTLHQQPRCARGWRPPESGGGGLRRAYYGPELGCSPPAEVVMSGWFQQQIVSTGRLPLFCFFVALVVGFGFVRLTVRLIRAQVRWWPGNVVAGDVHVRHIVFGVVFLGIGGGAERAAPPQALARGAGAPPPVRPAATPVARPV